MLGMFFADEPTIYLQTACDSLLPIVERAFVLHLLSGAAIEQVSLRLHPNGQHFLLHNPLLHTGATQSVLPLYFACC